MADITNPFWHPVCEARCRLRVLISSLQTTWASEDFVEKEESEETMDDEHLLNA